LQNVTPDISEPPSRHNSGDTRPPPPKITIDEMGKSSTKSSDSCSDAVLLDNETTTSQPLIANSQRPITPAPPSALQAATAPVAPLITTLVNPIQMAFEPSEHYALPQGRIPIVVVDNDIGSIIAYALTSGEYEDKRLKVS
jgi:hypothetical protein